MNRKWIFVLGLVVIALSWSGASAQQGSSEDWQGFDQGTVVQMPTTKAPSLFPGLGQEVPVMYGPGGREALSDAIRRSETPEGQNLLESFVPQQNTIDGFPPAAPPLGASFTGPAWGGIWIPGDPVIAAGSTYVGVMINSQFDFYTKAGVWSGGSILKNFFSQVYDSLSCRDPFDVKIIFDHHNNRWVMLALTYCSASSRSYYLVAVSQTINPLGFWWLWALDVMDPIEPTPLWADYPGLGFDADSGVYITSNQYLFGGGSQYAKIRALQKGALYSGVATWWDYWGMVDFDGTTTFTIKPVHTFGNPGTEYLVNSKWAGGNTVDIWSLLPGDPFPMNWGPVPIGWYFPPPTPPCSDSGLWLFDSRTQDAQYRNEHVYTSFHEEWDWGAGVKAVARFLKIDVFNMVAAIDERYGHPDYHYFFPTIYSAPNDNIVTVFNRCGGTEVQEFPSARYSVRFLTQGDVASRASLYLQAGQAWYGDWANPNRWGDYSGIAYDPFTYCTMWIYSMYSTLAPKPANWSTWIGSVFTHPGEGGDSLYWKPEYEDYAPNGMVDIDQKQDNWIKTDNGRWTFCGPAAVANCFKWFDSKYNVPPGAPGDGNDQFPLVRDYMDNLPPFFAGVWDDHDPWNVDHVNTPWGPPANPPPATPQPFMPGAQLQPSGMPAWGELVERLAWYFDTDGIQSGYCAFSGTKVQDMQDGVEQWFLSEQFPDGSTLWDSLYERTLEMPSFAEVETLVEMCEDVILLLGFWYEDPPGSGLWWRCGGHYVTVAGINSDSLLIALSDPWYDNAEAGGRGRIGTGNYIAHVWPHTDPTIHNDEGNVSHDIYTVSVDPVSPGGLWELADYPVSLNPSDCYNFEDMNVPDEHIPVSQPWTGISPIFTEVEYAVVISPKTPPDTLRNHFKTWQVEPIDTLLTVVVEDQFMQDDLTLDRIDFLSNPTRKDGFEIVDDFEHLTWYRASGRDTLLEIEYSNQFGIDTVHIDSVKYLLLPTAKEVPDPFPEELDHYKAYRIKDQVAFERMVELEDQFDLMYGSPEFIDSLKATYFLTPALKNMPPPMFDPITHYVAYEIFPKRFFPLSVSTFDQFGEHVLKVDTSKFLLVPTEKLRAEPPPPPDTLRNHFKTWRIEPQTFWDTAFVQDQFMSDNLVLDAVEFFSNPARKDSFEIVDNIEHLTWYRAHGRDTSLQVEYSNQFETDTVLIDSVKYLLLPTAKEVPAPFPENLDHYKAYRIKDPVAFDRTVELEDQFDLLYGAPEFIETVKPKYFLTPALKNKPPPMFDSVTHYVAYEIIPEHFFPIAVNTYDQFGEYVLQVDTSKFLLVPTGKLRAQPPPNDPPEIIQPDTLHGYQVCDTVIYTFEGADPDSDAIFDSASLTIEPSCGTYSVQRVTNPGGSSGKWQVTWDTHGCLDSTTYKIIVDLTDAAGNVSYCTTYCHLDPNNPPTIEQPDFLEGIVDDIVQYNITGSDPDGDVILDSASIDIQPGCGTYFITRLSGHGTSSGTWEVRWFTDGCTPCDTHMVIHDLSDGCDTSYCTTYVHLSAPESLYWKPPYEDYAPSGMVDIDQKQDSWGKPTGGVYTFCGPVAVANCFKWFDSKYNVPPGAPCDGFDQFPLVRDYWSSLPPIWCPAPADDHAPENMDHPQTPWLFGATPPPPGTPQPFVPGPQPAGVMPAWGELVERLAWYFNTDGVQTGYCEFMGTNVFDMQAGIDQWFHSEMFPDGSTLADTFYEYTIPMPTFTEIETLAEICEDVILLLGFWYQDPSSGEWWRCGGHYVTVAGVNSQDFRIAVADPFFDNAEAGGPGRVGDGIIIPHPHGGHDVLAHNDEGNVSHDIYGVDTMVVSPGGLWELIDYPVSINPGFCYDFHAQNVPPEFGPLTQSWDGVSPIFTEVEYAVVISPRPPNDPPEIIQPDSLYDYKVCDTVVYTFDGSDPDGDPILDAASLSIEPPCGTYSVIRLTGHGTSTGTWEVTWETIGCQDSITYMIIVDLTDTHGATSYCTTYCHLDKNNPPEIFQPDFLEGYVDDVVQYDIQGSDPDGDVIVDQASIIIIPGCGSYSIVRTAGHGTSYGVWQVTWSTFGCTPCDTHMVIHDLTDGCDTSYCTTYVHLSEIEGWHWKDPYEDYAPNGMVDIDQRQDEWIKAAGPAPFQWTFCGPCAVANCFKWFDSKYNQVAPGFPGDSEDMFPLVRDYLDDLPPLWTPPDDHAPDNIDHMGTPWNPAIGPPPPTLQPFVPGPQIPGGGLPPWGELVERLAWFFNTDGIQSGYCEFSGTNVMMMQQGIQDWLQSEMFPDGSTLADTLCEVTTPMPTFAYVESLVEKCEDVILLLGFWYENPPGSGQWWRIGGHYVTVAGVNSDQFLIAFSDPFIDMAEMGWPGRVRDGIIIPHPHGSHDPTTHNDEGNISHDIYYVDTMSVSPGGDWWIPEYAVMFDPGIWSENFYHQNVPDEFFPMTAPWDGTSPIFTEVEYCVRISPWDYRGDINVPYGDGAVNAADVVFLLNYLFRTGNPPIPYIEGDVTCDGVVTAADVVRLLNYLFLGWPAPRCCDP